jgi:phosphoribosylanthranilate isomerase
MRRKTRTKICGLTREQDVEAAVKAGADAIGLVFYPPSPRAVTPDQATLLAARVPAFVSVVGLFVNPEREEVLRTLEQVPLDLLQFHGDEVPELCASFGRRWIKAVRVRASGDIEAAFRRYEAASGLLADAWSPDKFGGTGKSFNWDLIPGERPMPLILAGGLASDNVAGAVRQVRPWAVDVSGGVESSKGIKDSSRMTDFISEVHRVDTTD